MYSNEKMLKSSLEEQQKKEEEERRMERRRQWEREQIALKKHEERKLKMIENYERKRAEEIAQRLRQNENNNPPRRIDYKYPEELEISSSENQKSTIIEEKELKKIKVKVTYYKETHKTGNKNVSTNKIERNICNPDDIQVLPRGKNKQLSDEESIDIQKNKSIDRLHKLTSRQDDKYINERKQRQRSYSRSTRKNEEDRSRNERTKSLSRCNNDIVLEDRSSSRRSRSNSFSNRAAKEEQNFNENKFSSRRNRSHKPYDRVLHEELTTSYFPFPHNFYNAYMHFPGPMPMYRIQAPPFMWSTVPRQFSAPFPPNMIRWRPNPPRFPNANRRFHGNSY